MVGKSQWRKRRANGIFVAGCCRPMAANSLFTDHCSGKVAFAPAVAAVFSKEK